jgi:GT2 family glycosyltransferase
MTGRVDAAGKDMLVVVTSSIASIQDHPRLKFDSMSGGNMGASLDTFRKVGLFDEDPVLATAEDAEWAYRALHFDIPLIYDPAVSVQHFGWRDPKERVEQYRRYALSHGGFYGKYFRKMDLFILLRALLHFARSLRRWMVGRITGNAENAANGKAYFLGLLPGIVAGFRSNYGAPESL